VTDPAAMPVRGSAAPPPKIATVRAPRGGRLRETQGASLGAWPAAHVQAYGSPRTRTTLGAPPPLQGGLREAKKQNPGAKRAAGTKLAVRKMVNRAASAASITAPSSRGMNPIPELA
jgi:hypothetical protein